MTQRIEPFLIWRNALNFFLVCRKELSLILNMAQWIELFPCLPQRIEPYSKYGSMNWIGFSNVTQRIELFSLMWLTELTFFFPYDSQNWTFWNMTRGNELTFFFKKPQRIECFFNISQRTDFSLTQRIEFFLRRKELNLFLFDSKNWTFFSKYDSKNWTFFSSIWLKELFFLIWLKGLNSFFWIWLKELNLFLIGLKGLNFLNEYDSKNWTFFVFDSNFRTFFIEYDAINRTSFWVRLKDFYFWIWLKE